MRILLKLLDWDEPFMFNDPEINVFRTQEQYDKVYGWGGKHTTWNSTSFNITKPKLVLVEHDISYGYDVDNIDWIMTDEIRYEFEEGDDRYEDLVDICLDLDVERTMEGL